MRAIALKPRNLNRSLAAAVRSFFFVAQLWQISLLMVDFDESYFSYGEDVDLAWRAQLLGWKSWYTPRANAVHVGSGSSNEQMRFVDKPLFLQRHILKNRYLTIAKNASWPELVPLIFYWLISEPLVWFILFVRSPVAVFTLFLRCMKRSVSCRGLCVGVGKCRRDACWDRGKECVL